VCYIVARDQKKPLWRRRGGVAMCRGSWWEDETVKFVSARINNATHSRALTKDGQHNNIECAQYDRGDVGDSVYVKIIVIRALEAKICECAKKGNKTE
jgi:hypothetical protein